MAARPDHDSLVALLATVLSAQGLDLEDVVVTPAGRRRLLRVVVDRDGGVGLDTVAQASTSVAAVLDESDVMGATPYVLEVTSPGVDRPLSALRHWRRALSRLVTATTLGGEAVSGRLVAVDDQGVTLDPEDGSAPARLAWGQLGTGRVQVEFNRKEG